MKTNFALYLNDYIINALNIHIMNTALKKFSSYFLVSLVLVSTVIALLEIWVPDLLDLDGALQNLMSSLLIIFLSSCVVLFIFSVILKEKKEE